MDRTIFRRPWQSPEYPVFFDGISVLILGMMGFQGPPAMADAPRQVNYIHYSWPPQIPGAIKVGSPRRMVARHLLQVMDGDARQEAIVDSLLEGAKANDDDRLIAAILAQAPRGPIISTGGCMVPAVMTGDAMREADGPIEPGDLVAVQIRGSASPLIKGFVGLADGGRALFYMAHPSSLVSVETQDVLWAAKLLNPRDVTALDLINQAGPALHDYVAKHGRAGNLPPSNYDRWMAWGETMRAIYGLLRTLPEIDY